MAGWPVCYLSGARTQATDLTWPAVKRTSHSILDLVPGSKAGGKRRLPRVACLSSLGWLAAAYIHVPRVVLGA